MDSWLTCRRQPAQRFKIGPWKVSSMEGDRHCQVSKGAGELIGASADAGHRSHVAAWRNPDYKLRQTSDAHGARQGCPSTGKSGLSSHLHGS